MIRANGVIGPLREVLVYADLVFIVITTPRGIPYRVECQPGDEVEILSAPYVEATGRESNPRGDSSGPDSPSSAPVTG